jgi:hypothetical protein
MEKFEQDLNLLQTSLNEGLGDEARRKLEVLKNRLVHLRKKNIIKINHSAMELVCAKHLISKGYDLDVERELGETLVCDLYAVKEEVVLIVEIETGFVPPENALDPLRYYEARIASKIARYSSHSMRFGLGTPPHHILNIPSIFLTPPKDRSSEDLKILKGKCDKYYTDPSISIEDLRCAYLNSIYIINVDDVKVKELRPTDYSEEYKLLSQ